MNSLRNSRGYVTVELAIGIMTTAFVAVLLAWLIGLVGVQARCDESAARIARFESRNDEQLAAQARENVPEGAVVDVQKHHDRVLVTVSKEEYLGRFGPVKVEAKSIMQNEWGGEN